jgi:hypothetical protein
MPWRLTVRHGPRVSKEDFDRLEDAIDAMRAGAAEVVRAGPLEPARGFREYGAEERVAARLELSSGGFLRGREAGIDVMGDGRLVPYAGVVRKQRLDGRSPDAAFAAVESALR